MKLDGGRMQFLHANQEIQLMEAHNPPTPLRVVHFGGEESGTNPQCFLLE